MSRPFQHHKKQRNTVPKNRLIVGRKPLLEALDAGTNIEKIFLLQSAGGTEINDLRVIAKDKNIAVSYVPAEKLQQLTTLNHQGVVAIAGLVQYHLLQDVIDYTVDAGLVPLFVLLDGITDTRNVGAIARSAHCFGAQAIIVPLSNSAAITEDAVKTSAGALEQITICRTPSVEQAMDILHLNGIATIATALDDKAIDAEDIDWLVPTAIILGSEAKGVSQYVIKHAQHLTIIPMSATFDSLNVSVAAGIILYEANKKRRLID